MALEFNATEAPFDRLTGAERETTRAALDVAYFRPLQTIIARDGEPEGLFVVIKGCVEERDGGETVALRGPGDWFDSRALVQGRGANAFIAREETLCHLLPRAAALRLIADNPRFGAFFYADVSRKLGAVAADDDAARARPMMQTRVRDLRLAAAPVVAGEDTIAAVGARLDAAGANAALVRAGGRAGVVTGTDLWRATVLKRLPLTTPISTIATFSLVGVEADDFVARALMKMTKHNVRRVAVSDGGATIGFLEDIDLLAFLGAGSQAIAARIDRAASLDDLKPAAEQIAGQPRLLRRQGVKIEVVCEIVSDLNRSLFAKLFAALADRGRLPVRDGQRGPGRADVAHRPGQWPPPHAGGSGGRPGGVPRPLLGRARKFWLPALPRRRDGQQPQMVEDGGRLSRRHPALDRRARRNRRARRGNFVRRRAGGGRLGGA